jgi:hypothetical protein
MRHRLAIALTCLSVSAAHGAEIAGYVLAVQGTWSLQGSPGTLVVGAPITAGARLMARAPAVGDRIVVVEAKSGAVLAARRCDEPRACSLPLVVPTPAVNAVDPSLLQVVDRVIARIAGDPDRLVSTISRGPETLSDAILAWSPDSVDLAPALTRLPAGDYDLRLISAECDASRDCRPPNLSLTWPGSGLARYPLQGLGAGLYTLVVSDQRAKVGARPRRGTVLLSPESELAAARARYDAGVRLVASWGSAVDDGVKKAFLRALLEL